LGSDISILGDSPAQKKIHISCNLSEDSNFGAKVSEAIRQTLSNHEAISSSLHSTDLIFVLVNLGDAIGCGAAPALASLTKQRDALAIAFVIVPFDIADNALKASLDYIEKSVDTVVLLSEDCIMESVREIMPGMTEPEIQMEVLKMGVQVITLMITECGIICIDYADMLVIMRKSGKAYMGLSSAAGEDRAEKAVLHAISQPLLGRSRLAKASQCLVHVYGGKDILMREVQQVISTVHDVIDRDAKFIYGVNVEEECNERIWVTIIATGFDLNVK
jgi:cell division protein FtsZ